MYSISHFTKQLPADAAKTGLYLAISGLVGIKAFPVLREWEVFSSFPSKAYMEREVRVLSTLFLQVLVGDQL